MAEWTPFYFFHMTFLNENPHVEKFWKLYNQSFDQLYLYCARRATTKPVIAFIMKSLYENAFDEMKRDETITLLDLYKWAYEFFSIQSQPGQAGSVAGDSSKKIGDLHDVYDIKTDSGSRSIRREEILRNFYTQLSYKEREVLWLTFFEEVSIVDRAIVMGMKEEECTTLYYDALKKAKDVVGAATTQQKGFSLSQITSYFGSAASLLKKAREHENIAVDQEILTSLRELFMEQFARASAQNFYQPQEPQQGQPAAQPQPLQPEPDFTLPTQPQQPPRAQPLYEQPARARTIVQEQKSVVDSSDDEFYDDDESLGRILLRKLQGVAVIVLIVIVGTTGYFKFFSENARVDRLLADSRVKFSEDFSQDQKVSFAKEALLYLADGRDYSALNVQRKDKVYVQVSFDIDGNGKESFTIYRQEQSFDYKYLWQPKVYTHLLAV